MTDYDFQNVPNIAASEAIKNTLKNLAQQSFRTLEDSQFYQKLYWFRLKTDNTNSVKTLKEHYYSYLFYINPYADNIGRGTRS